MDDIMIRENKHNINDGVVSDNNNNLNDNDNDNNKNVNVNTNK
jgi:hypothetical protein